MEITDGRIATIHYTLTDDAGEVLDRSLPQAPLSYLHGAGNIVPGLEKALDGKTAGDELRTDIEPEQGYGPRHRELVQRLPRSAFPEPAAVKPGMQFETLSQGARRRVLVTEVGPEQVTVDGNHPLAGQTLHFTVQVAEVREATEQEMNQGHASAAA